MEKPSRSLRSVVISLIGLAVVTLLLWACDIGSGRPTATTGASSEPATGASSELTKTMDPVLVVLPTVAPEHPHEQVGELDCPRCMGHMYSVIVSSTRNEHLKIFAIVHDHGTPNLVSSTVALVSDSPTDQSPEVYLDPAWDFQFDPARLPNSEACNITDPEAQEKLARVVDELVPELVALPVDVGTNIHLPRAFNDLFNMPLPTRTLTSSQPTPVPPLPDKQEVTCIVIAEDRNNNNRLILAVDGMPLVTDVDSGLDTDSVPSTGVTPSP